MRINFKLVFITIVLLVTIVPVFKFYANVPDYKIVPLNAGKILASFDTGHIRGALIITYKDGKIHVFKDKLLKKQLASFDLPGKLIDYGSWLADENYEIFMTLNNERNSNKLRVFFVNQYEGKVVLKSTATVTGTSILGLLPCIDSHVFILYDDTRMSLDLYDIDGIKTDSIDANIISYNINDYPKNEIFIYDGLDLKEYILDYGKIVKGKTAHIPDNISRKDAPVFSSDDLFTIPLFDRDKVIFFDSNLNICFSMRISRLNKDSQEGNFYNNPYGSVHISHTTGRANQFNQCYQATMFHVGGYNFRDIPSNYPDGLYEYSSNDNHGVVLLHGKDQLGDYKYLAYSGIPKGIDYLIWDFEKGNIYTFYIYYPNSVYIAKYNDFEVNYDTIRTVEVNLPANVSMIIDWGQYITFAVIIIVCLLATGALNTILKLF